MINRIVNEFKLRREPRQGDPMVSFLFPIVAKGLEGLLREAKRKNHH